MKSASVWVLSLGLLALPVRADELDDLGLPPLPGDDQGLPELPVAKPSATPQAGKTATAEPDLDLPPLPGDEPAKASSSESKKGNDSLSDLDLPALPGEEPKKPEANKAGEKNEDGNKPEILLMTEEPEAATPEPTPVAVERPKARHPKAPPAPKKKVLAAPPARPPRPAATAPSSPPLPGMDFWTASLLGPLLPQGGRAILIYLLLSLILPWAGQSRFAAAAALRIKQLTKKA